MEPYFCFIAKKSLGSSFFSCYAVFRQPGIVWLTINPSGDKLFIEPLLLFTDVARRPFNRDEAMEQAGRKPIFSFRVGKDGQ